MEQAFLPLCLIKDANHILITIPVFCSFATICQEPSHMNHTNDHHLHDDDSDDNDDNVSDGHDFHSVNDGNDDDDDPDPPNPFCSISLYAALAPPSPFTGTDLRSSSLFT